MIRAIVELGGTYPDVVLALQQAKTAHALTGRFEVDAVPAGGRNIGARITTRSPTKWKRADQIEVANPVPELFSNRRLRKIAWRCGADASK